MGSWDALREGMLGEKGDLCALLEMRCEKGRRKQWVGFPTTESGGGGVGSQVELERCGPTFSHFLPQEEQPSG